MADEKTYLTVEDVQALSKEIGMTIRRLLEVLKANQVIDDIDIKYVQGKITVDELKGAKRHEIRDFLDVLFSKPTTESDNETPT